MAFVLTETGRKHAEFYINGLKEKRKEIMDACKDTCEDTFLPDLEVIESDVNDFAEDGEYYNNWGVTDHYDGDYPLCLQEGIDYKEEKNDELRTSV